MDLDQGGDWSEVYHVSVRLAAQAHEVRYVEYFWSHLVEIEKVMPTAVLLAESGADGLYRVPLTRAQSRAGNWLVIRVSYADNRGDDYGLLTAKHFTETYTNAKGHEVKRVSVLARAPFAWVKPHVPSHVSPCVFTGDAVYGYRPESIVSRVYSTVDVQFRNVLFHVTAPDKDAHIETLVRDTLSKLAAPLAFKAVYEQSRLTLEHLRDDARRDAPVESTMWGTSVLWTLCEELAEFTVETFTRHEARAEYAARRRDYSSAAGWLEVGLTRDGLVTAKHATRQQSQRITREFVDAPYWSVILTAFCCGALNVWRGAMFKLLAELKVDSAKQPTDVRALCQRCGFNCRDTPIISPKEPVRVLAVSQIDKILFGDLCTSLCARVFSAYYRADGVEREAKQDRGRCLNHKRQYSASFEEEWEEQQQEDQEDQQENSSHPNASSTARGANRECRRGQQDETESRYRSQSERCERDRASSYSQRQGRSERNEPDPGWWLWQKRCRDRRRGKTGGVQSRKRRLWELYAENWGTAEDSDGNSTSVRCWRDFSCRSTGYHVKTLPFGHAGGPLTI